jgi:hypothetical protein
VPARYITIRAASATGRRVGKRGGGWTTIAFLGYLAISFVFLGIRLVPHPNATLIGDFYADPQIFVWSFAWLPHALLHGENPIYTHAIWAPSGFDLVWGTSVPALALAFAPLTLAFGPIFAYNAACIVMAALAAWSAFLLCRHITGALWPSLVGGYLFGFSSYMLGGELDHIHTVAVFVLPLIALLVLRFLEAGISSRAFTVELAALLALQAYISTEILFTLTLALACSLILGFAVAPPVRPRLLQLVRPLAYGYAVAALLAAPIFYYALKGYSSRPPTGSEDFTGDLLNFVIPTSISFGGWWTTHVVQQFPANVVEQGAYLGLPTLLIVCWFAFTRRRTATARFLLSAFVIAGLASLGSWLTVDGHRLITLPWIHLASRPLFENIAPVRLSVFTALSAAVIVSIWAASATTRLPIRVLLSALALLAVTPNLTWGDWANTPKVPRLFTTGFYRSCLPQGETVLALPFGPGGSSMLWQADSSFWFRLAGGYVSPTAPPEFNSPHPIQQIAANDQPPKVTTQDIREFVRLKHVDTIVLDATQASRWQPLLDQIERPEQVAGVIVYRLTGTPRGSRQSCRPGR